MKNYPLLILLCGLLATLSSCDTKDRYYPYKSWSMEIENNSDYTVHIQYKSNERARIDIDTTLESKKSFVLSYGNNDAAGGSLDAISYRLYDSVIVSFTKTNKKLAYWYDRNSRIYNDSTHNMLLEENFVFIHEKKSHTTYSYTIENSDYTRAE